MTDSKAANTINRLGGVAYEDEILVTVDCYIGFIERLRILWHGRATVHVTTLTQNVVGETKSSSLLVVPRVFPQKPQGEVEMESHALDT